MMNILKTVADLADEAIPCSQIPGCETGTAATGDAVVGDIMNIVFWALGIVGVIILVYGGILFMLSQGDPGKAQKARMTIIYAAIGIIVVIAAAAITNFVLGAL